MAELFGKLDAPLNRGSREGAFYSITLDEPHLGLARAVLDGEVSGWSRVKKRLGKTELHEGDRIIINRFRVMSEAVVAVEIG